MLLASEGGPNSVNPSHNLLVYGMYFFDWHSDTTIWLIQSVPNMSGGIVEGYESYPPPPTPYSIQPINKTNYSTPRRYGQKWILFH